MNSSELITEISRKSGLEKDKVSEYVGFLNEIFTEQLKQKNSLSIPGIGTLEVRKKNERVIVHPASGKKMLIPPKLTVNLKPTNPIKEKINQNQK